MNLDDLGFKNVPYSNYKLHLMVKSSKDYKLEVLLLRERPVKVIWYAWSPIDYQWVQIGAWDEDLDYIIRGLLWYVQTLEERKKSK